jgi:hypothetical protein
MNVTKDVVRDLMPLYLADEASGDTRRLVEEYLRKYPGEFQMEEAFGLPEVEVPPSVEMVSLERTRKLFGQRTQALAAALAISYSVFSFRFDDHGLNFVLYRDLPVLAWMLLAAGVVVWALFLRLHRRWVLTGLNAEAHSGYGFWLMGGALAFLPYAFVLSYRFGVDDVRALCVVGAFVGLAIMKAIHRRSNVA